MNISADDADNGHMLGFRSATRGMAFPPRLQDRVFEPFFSADAADSTKQGLGLGLSIVKSIVGSVGGRIEFESTVGKGTCFRVYLPSKQP